MTYSNEYHLGRRVFHQNQEASLAFVMAAVAVILVGAGCYILNVRFHIRVAQLIELSLYVLYGLIAAALTTWYFVTLHRRREANWPHPPSYISPEKDREAVQSAYAQDAIVLGYNVHRKPWLWPDRTRVMQSVVFGATGFGKTTLLKNIITQDLFRIFGTP